jgi:hypothetical protein
MNIVLNSLPITFRDLQNAVAVELDDADGGNYANGEIAYAVLKAHRESVVAAKSYKVALPFATEAALAAYDLSPIFQPLAVSVDTQLLEKKGLADIAMINPYFQTVAEGMPKTWSPVSGSFIMLAPTPDKVYTGIATGNAAPPLMVADGDVPKGIASAFAVQVIVGRAVRHCRAMRPMYANNIALIEALDTEWTAWVGQQNAVNVGR